MRRCCGRAVPRFGGRDRHASTSVLTWVTAKSTSESPCVCDSTAEISFQRGDFRPEGEEKYPFAGGSRVLAQGSMLAPRSRTACALGVVIAMLVASPAS